MENFVDIRLTIPADNEAWQEFMAGFDDYNGDEEFLIPRDPALQKWFDWLMEYESEAFYQCDGFSLEGTQAMLGFMPDNPKKFAEAMLRLLEHAGASDLRAENYSPDRDDGVTIEWTLAYGQLQTTRKTRKVD